MANLPRGVQDATQRLPSMKGAEPPHEVQRPSSVQVSQLLPEAKAEHNVQFEGAVPPDVHA